MGGRASVAQFHILDSSAGTCSAMIEGVNDEDKDCQPPHNSCHYFQHPITPGTTVSPPIIVYPGSSVKCSISPGPDDDEI